MSSFECSPLQLRNAASNATIIGDAIGANPVNALAVGDLGHAGVAAALEMFRSAWMGEYALRQQAAAGASQLLAAAAADAERLDDLLSRKLSQLGEPQ